VTTEALDRTTPPLGRYLKEKREEARLSQDQVADESGFTQGAVSAWERGVRIPTARALMALGRVLPGADLETMLELLEKGTAA
jgi:transcriptional regulator with XRE-family HTH domain